MAHQEEEPGERDGHVPQRPGEEDDPKKDQQEDQPLPESLSMCPVGLKTRKEDENYSCDFNFIYLFMSEFLFFNRKLHQDERSQSVFRNIIRNDGIHRYDQLKKDPKWKRTEEGTERQGIIF